MSFFSVILTKENEQLKTFNIESSPSTDIIEVEPDPMVLEIEHKKYKKKFTKDEWLVIGLYMMNGDCLLSYNQVHTSIDKRKNKGLSKVFFEEDKTIKEIRRRLSIMIRHHQHLIHRIIQEYEIMAFSNIEDYATWNNWNVKLLPSALLTRKQKVGILEIKPTKYGPSIKLHSKKDALDSLSKIVGILRDSINLTTNDISDNPGGSKPVIILPNNNRG